MIRTHLIQASSKEELDEGIKGMSTVGWLPIEPLYIYRTGDRTVFSRIIIHTDNPSIVEDSDHDS